MDAKSHDGHGRTGYLEEGAAIADLAQREQFDVIVVGAGQAGLSVGHYLAKSGLRFVILDGSSRIGDSWRRRWDSLRLFTPARFNGLPEMRFPAHPDYFPTKDEMGDFLESYAARFQLPVRSGTWVRRVYRRGGRYVVATPDAELEADHLVVAMAGYQKRRVPRFASELSSDIVQLHSSEYKNPVQLRAGGVLVVGAGNSGAEIAMELSRQHRVWMSGRDVGQIPFRIGGLLGRLLLVRIVLRVIFHRVISIRTPIGRRLRPKLTHVGGPLIRTRRKDLRAAGVEFAPRTQGAQDGLPRLADGRVLDMANVVWCTGYDSALSWLDLPVLDERGNPRHVGGLVEGEPGLYFVGRHFLYALSSAMVHGVGRDAERIVRAIAARSQTAVSRRHRRGRPRPAVAALPIGELGAAAEDASRQVRGRARLGSQVQSASRSTAAG